MRCWSAMSVRSGAPLRSPAAAVEPASDDRDLARTRARSRRHLLVQALRVGLGAFIIGSWELTTRLEWVDPFFFGQPSGIAQQLVVWVRKGTAQGPLWEQILVTLEETVLGFAVGVVLGVIFGVALGRSRLLSDVCGP